MSKAEFFTVEHSNDVLIISPLDSIGSLEGEAVRDDWVNVLAELESTGVERAVIDLTALDYFGSIMLELIVVLWKRLSGRAGKLALCNVSPVGLEILKAAKFDTIWPVVVGVDAAVDAVRD